MNLPAIKSAVPNEIDFWNVYVDLTGNIVAVERLARIRKGIATTE